MRLNVTQVGDDGAPSVALLHGLFGQGRNLGVVARGLVAAGLRVLSLDVRNHGRSPHAPGMDYATLAADVAETLDGHEAWPAALVGHSLGGKIAMRLALDAPTRITRLVVADIAPRPYAPHFREIADAMMALDPALLTRAAADAVLARTESDPNLRAFLLANAVFGAGGGWRIGLDEIRAALPDIEAFATVAGERYSGPTLIVAGERSHYIRDEDWAIFDTLFPAATCIVIPDAGHWLHADNPEAVTQALVAFLAPP